MTSYTGPMGGSPLSIAATAGHGMPFGSMPVSPRSPCLTRSISANHFLYDGQYLDTVSGLYYLRARWYDPATGQFTSVDALVSLTRQPYSYAGNNPINGGDPLGLSWCGFLPVGCGEIQRVSHDVVSGLDKVRHAFASFFDWIGSNGFSIFLTVLGVVFIAVGLALGIGLVGIMWSLASSLGLLGGIEALVAGLDAIMDWPIILLLVVIAIIAGGVLIALAPSANVVTVHQPERCRRLPLRRLYA